MTPFFRSSSTWLILRVEMREAGSGGADEQARDVAHVDEPAGAQGARDPAGDEVGIHVVGLAVIALGHRGNHRDVAVGDLLLDQFHLNLGDFADEPKVDRVAVVVGVQLLADEDAVAGQTLGLALARCDGLADVAVDDLVEGPLDDRDRGLVGDPEPVLEGRLEAGLLHRPGDRLAAAVDDDDVDPRRRKGRRCRRRRGRACPGPGRP